MGSILIANEISSRRRGGQQEYDLNQLQISLYLSIFLWDTFGTPPERTSKQINKNNLVHYCRQMVIPYPGLLFVREHEHFPQLLMLLLLLCAAADTQTVQYALEINKQSLHLPNDNPVAVHIISGFSSAAANVNCDSDWEQKRKKPSLITFRVPFR